jgi:hypothetical protein
MLLWQLVQTHSCSLHEYLAILHTVKGEMGVADFVS